MDGISQKRSEIMIKSIGSTVLTKRLSKFIITLATQCADAAYMCSGMWLLRECVEKEYNDGKVHKGRHIEEG